MLLILCLISINSHSMLLHHGEPLKCHAFMEAATEVLPNSLSCFKDGSRQGGTLRTEFLVYHQNYEWLSYWGIIPVFHDELDTVNRLVQKAWKVSSATVLSC